MRKKKNQRTKNKMNKNLDLFEFLISNHKVKNFKFYDTPILFEMFKLDLFIFIYILYFDILILKIYYIYKIIYI